MANKHLAGKSFRRKLYLMRRKYGMVAVTVGTDGIVTDHAPVRSVFARPFFQEQIVYFIFGVFFFLMAVCAEGNNLQPAEKEIRKKNIQLISTVVFRRAVAAGTADTPLLVF